MGTINVNGKIYKGNSVSINNGVVTIDGKVQNEKNLKGIVKIVVEGDLASLKTDESVEVNGDVKGNVDAGGSVTCRNVGGDVESGGSTHCGDVSGSVDAGGSVHCGNIGGNIDAGGSVSHS